jgi:hypothetical protein
MARQCEVSMEELLEMEDSLLHLLEFLLVVVQTSFLRPLPNSKEDEDTTKRLISMILSQSV